MISQTDYQLKPGETPEQYNARIAALRGTDTSKMAKDAGAAGASLNELSSILGPSAEEQQAAKDELAKNFGYSDFNAFTADAFTKPSQNTQQIYESAYKAAGLDQLFSKISDRRQKLLDTEEQINDNPWLSEASRSGRVGRIRDKLNAEIANLQSEYDTTHNEVKDLVTRNSEDFNTNAKIAEARMNWLTKAIEEKANSSTAKNLATYLSDYTAGKNAQEKPQTITVGDDVYQWDPLTKKFTLAVRGKASLTATERTANAQAAAVSKARPTLLASVGQDGYVDPATYQSLREDYAGLFGESDSFDEVFANRLSPQERARLGVGTAAGVKAAATGGRDL